MSHNTKYYRKKLKKTESSKKIDVLFRQQALASENSANITPKQTEKVEASAEIAESSASTKNCPSTSAGVPSQCDDTHSNHDSSDDDQSSDGSQSTQDTCLVPDQRLFMSSKYERRYNWLYYSAAKGGYCCKICELFAQESDNIFINEILDIFVFIIGCVFFPILYKTTRKFPILGVRSCSQNAEKKPCMPFLLFLKKRQI